MIVFIRLYIKYLDVKTNEKFADALAQLPGPSKKRLRHAEEAAGKRTPSDVHSRIDCDYRRGLFQITLPCRGPPT